MPAVRTTTRLCRPWTAWLLALVLTLCWDAAGVDPVVMRWWGDVNGFALRDHWWLSVVLHDQARQLAVAGFAWMWLMVPLPIGLWRRLPAQRRLEMALGTTLCLLAVNWVKRHSLTSCPWDLEAFGGMAQYVSHWRWGIADGGPGHCFPGGHASAAFAFWPLALGWSRHDPRRMQRWGYAIGLTGLLLGGVQTLRGAHYPSHTAWTAILCAALALANHHLFLRLAQPVFRPAQPAE